MAFSRGGWQRCAASCQVAQNLARMRAAHAGDCEDVPSPTWEEAPLRREQTVPRSSDSALNSFGQGFKLQSALASVSCGVDGALECLTHSGPCFGVSEDAAGRPPYSSSSFGGSSVEFGTIQRGFAWRQRDRLGTRHSFGSTRVCGAT